MRGKRSLKRRLPGQSLLPCGDRGLVKEVPMDPVTFLIDLVWGGPQRPQNGLRQGQSHFPLTREHALCSGLVESGQIADIRRASEDPDS